jgi:hypothetical protein
MICHTLNCCRYIFCIFFGELECVGNSFAYAAYFVFLMKVWIRTKAVNREVKLSRRYRDRDLAKFESSRRYRER